MSWMNRFRDVPQLVRGGQGRADRSQTGILCTARDGYGLLQRARACKLPATERCSTLMMPLSSRGDSNAWRRRAIRLTKEGRKEVNYVSAKVSET